MKNEEKAQKICEKNKQFHVECSSLECYLSAMDMAQWKDEQFKQLLIEKTKLLSPSAAQDSVKRCTIEEIYRELFGEEIPNTNPYIK